MNKNQPYFSIIIPTYNRAHLIKETIASVQSQTFENWECIVVDDGSTDNTKEVIAELIKNDERIKYIYQENAERSVARNKGIKNAKGDYICFLDSDDLYESNHLETLLRHIKKQNNPKALFFTNYIEEINNQTNIPNVPSIINYTNKLAYLMTHAIIPARVCIHKTILEQNQFDEDITIVEDVILWTRIANEYPVFQIKEPTVKYVIHEDNSIHIKGTGAIKRLNGLKVFFKRYPKVISKFPKALQPNLVSNTHFNIAKHYIYHSHRIKAIKHILLSFYYQPIHKQNRHKINTLIKLIIGKKIDEYKK